MSAIEGVARNPDRATKLGERARATAVERFRATIGAERIFRAIEARLG